MNAHVVPHVLTGEVLGPRDDVRVVASLHPLVQARIERRFPAGATLADMVESIAAEPGCRSIATDFIVHIDGHPIAPVIWSRVRPKPFTTVTMRPTVTGFLAPLFTAIAGLLSSFSAWISAAGWFGKLIMTGLSIGAKLLINALFAPRPPKQETPKIGYSFAGARNQAAPFEAVPVIFGNHRFSPFYGAMPYTETVGDDQYLRCLFVWGYGPLKIENLQIGETALSSFENVQIENFEGYASDADQTLYPNQVVEEPLSIDMKKEDGWQQRSTAENVSEISFDLVAPNGFRWIDDKGRKKQNDATFQVRYRIEGTTEWTNFLVGGSPDIEIKGNTPDTKRWTWSFVVPAGKYEVAIQRTKERHDDHNTWIGTIIWTALRGFRPGKPILFDKPLCITAIRIKATSQLNGALDTFNGVVTSLVKSWSGAAWVDNQPSRNPADLYRHVLQGSANARPKTDGEIDLVALQGWAEYCTANDWTYDKPVTSVVSVYDQLLEICAAGRAMPVFKDGKWSVIWDEQSTPVVQMFTPRNSWGFEASHEFHDLPHGWRVKFVNEKKKWIEDERIVYDDGYNAASATKFEALQFPGVTNPDAIWKHGRFHLAQLRLRPETYTINVDFENLICTRGDRVRVAHDVMLVGIASGRAVAIDAGTKKITLDERVTMEAGKSYQVRLRLADGSFLVRSVVTGPGETDVIALDGPGDVPAGGDLFTFGESGLESAVYRVLGIEPQEDLAAKLTLVDDAPGIYDADSGSAPPFVSSITAPYDPFTQPPTDIRMTEGVYEEDNTFLSYIRLNWKAPAHGAVRAYEVKYMADDQWRPGPTGAATTADVRGLDSGVYTFGVRCIFEDGGFSAWALTPAFSSNILNNPPADVEDFAISVVGDTSTLTWTAVQRGGVTYEIRFASADNASIVWNAATTLLSGISSVSVQVPTMSGTYLIKAVIPGGMKSTNATSISTNVAGLANFNAVETVTENPSFAGAKEDVTVAAGILKLANVTNGVAVSGTYYFDGSVDLGDVFTSRVTAGIEASGEDTSNVMANWMTLASLAALDNSSPEDWEVGLEYRATAADPLLDEWSVWTPFLVGDVTARAYQFRLILNGRDETGDGYSSITPAVKRLSVQVDMPDRVVAGENIVVPVAGLDISFSPPFISLQGLATADQDLATGDIKEITAKSKSGFHIQFRDSGGTPVERTIDYVAKGYGAKQ